MKEYRLFTHIFQHSRGFIKNKNTSKYNVLPIVHIQYQEHSPSSLSYEAKKNWVGTEPTVSELGFHCPRWISATASGFFPPGAIAR
jgi:hypothetical protein